MEKLRECPFCGGKAEYVGYRLAVECEDCGCGMLSDEKWNTRFKPQYETPDHYFRRTGTKWPDDAPVWCRSIAHEWGILMYGVYRNWFEDGWRFENEKEKMCEKYPCVCATEAGKPPSDWRP